jgi:outer membrane protein OmpA-like peptidoglycan-associated protein
LVGLGCLAGEETVRAEQLAKQWRRTKSLAQPEVKVRKGMAVVGAEGAGLTTVETPVAVETSASFQNIRFRFNRAEIEDEASRAQVVEIARAMQLAGSEKFLIEGHTCDVGDERSNLGLSVRRAMAVRDALVSLGISGERLQAVGCGMGYPLKPNVDEASREANRRVQVFRRE